MPNQVQDLTSDQLRRIFRDYLAGRPREKLMKKYDISEEVFWEIVGMYSKKKHPNDVGNAQDIQGPADLLVTPLDTGSSATEHPIVARNPEDLAVTRERVIAEFDYNSPEEELRKKGGEVNDLIRDRAAKTAEDQRNEARGAIKENLEATDAILEELTETSEGEKAAIAEKAVERAKAAPSAEETLRLRNERLEAGRRAEVAAEAQRAKTAEDHAREMQEKWPEMVEAGKKQNEEAAKAEAEARQKETDARAQEVQSAVEESAGREGEAGERPSERSQDRAGPDQVARRSDISTGSGQGARGDQSAPSAQGSGPSDPGQANRQGGGSGTTDRAAGGDTRPGEAGAVQPANTSPTSQPSPVEPAKVEPDGLKEK